MNQRFVLALIVGFVLLAAAHAQDPKGERRGPRRPEAQSGAGQAEAQRIDGQMQDRGGRGPGQRGPRSGPGPNFGGFGGMGGGGGPMPPRFNRPPDRVPEGPIDMGYFFLDGQYLAPPYRIKLEEGGVTVNGRLLPCKAPQAEFGGDPRFENRNFDPFRRLASDIGNSLANQCVVMAFPDQPLVVLDGGAGAYDLFQRLTGEGKNPSKVELVDRLPNGFDERVWNDWLGKFTPSLGLRARATSLITSFDQTDADAQAEISAVRRLNRFTYPLTLGGMILTVLSIGHLLGGRPAAGKSAYEQDASPETLRALQYSLILVGLFSLLDLAQTIMTSQAGQMREVNPFGSSLIQSPALLSLFKIGATGLSIGLLFALRKYRRAQVAAWWACLILTVLALRWLTFNSMMISV